MQPNEPDDREHVDPAEAEAPAHEMPPETRDAPLTTHGAVPAPLDPEPALGGDDDGAERDAGAPDAPASDADAVGYDDPSESPVRALRDAQDDRG